MATYRQYRDTLKLSGAGRVDPPKPLTPAVLSALEEHVRDTPCVSPVALLDTAGVPPTTTSTPARKRKAEKTTRDEQLERIIHL